VSIVTITILIFLHWKKGSNWWVKLAPSLFHVLVFTNYVVVPVVVICTSVIVAIRGYVDNVVDAIESFTVFFDVLMVLHNTEYFTFIRPVILVDAKFYCKSRHRISAMSAEQIERELLEEELSEHTTSKQKLNTLHNFLSEKLPYLERSKHFGQGQLRIGKSLELETSIYDLAFVS
jgi:hypothetical protein